jgi:ectoine hydroxylase-related dioxygenase (phytanoyl-CoA dioxygenase family)
MEIDLASYRDKGFLTVDGLVSEKLLSDLEATIGLLIETAIGRLGKAERAAFDEICDGSGSLLHEGLQALHKVDKRQAQFVIDAAGNSQSLHSIFSDEHVVNAAMRIVGVNSARDLGVAYHVLRVDYPEFDPAHNALISLPHHQESGYYKVNVSAGTGTVLWAPLFDCGPREGSLVVRESSHALGLVEHERYFLDPAKQRHLRVRLPESVVADFPEVRLDVPRNAAAFQHFNLFHASGKNASDKVRYTMLARYSDLTAEDYFPVSWQ